ncbi:MAG: hypothetical protein QOI89_3411 [Solirubrobacteraceae bacterium]|nr:hypothetical protein [Solirubrobacteraceae bacterium]
MSEIEEENCRVHAASSEVRHLVQHRNERLESAERADRTDPDAAWYAREEADLTRRELFKKGYTITD